MVCAYRRSPIQVLTESDVDQDQRVTKKPNHQLTVSNNAAPARVSYRANE